MTDWTQAAVNTLTAAGIVRVYPLGEVPPSPPYPYAVVSATREGSAGAMLDSSHALGLHRVTVQVFAKTSARIAEMADLVDGALQDRRLIDAPTCGPCDLQVAALTRDPDDAGVLGHTSTYLFIVTREHP